MDESISEFIWLVLAALAWLAVLGTPAVALLYACYWLVGLPFRWLEQARLFLDVVEAGINEGISPELAIQAVSERHERAIGAKFHLLAAWTEKGLRLGEALDKVPRLVPAQLAALLKIGEATGDLRRVLPAGRKIIADATNRARNPREGLVGVTIATTLVAIYIITVMVVFVFPKFQEMLLDMEVTPPALFTWLHDNFPLWLCAQGIFLVLVVLALLLYMGGPMLAAWVDSRAPALADFGARLLPWRHTRLQGDFSLLLAILLEAGVPEEKAVQFAADFTASRHFRHRSDRVIADLRNGVKLSEAVRHLDPAGEFRWRVAFAQFDQGRFVKALEGWHLTIEAAALKQEQIVAGATNLVMVLFNGTTVAVLGIAIFGSLIAVMDSVAPW